MTQHRRRPHLPWMKDETISPRSRITNARAMRLMLVAVVVFSVVLGVGALYVINQQGRIGMLARQNAAATAELQIVTAKIEAIQKRNHASRLADQERTDRQLRQLACVIVSQVNEDAKGYPAKSRRAVKQFRAYYHCPPYSDRSAANPFPTSAMPVSSPHTPAPSKPSRPVSPSATPTPHAAPRPSVTRVPTPTVTHTRTVTAQPTASSAPPAPAPVRSLVCGLLRAVNICRTETP